MPPSMVTSSQCRPKFYWHRQERKEERTITSQLSNFRYLEVGDSASNSHTHTERSSYNNNILGSRVIHNYFIRLMILWIILFQLNRCKTTKSFIIWFTGKSLNECLLHINDAICCCGCGVFARVCLYMLVLTWNDLYIHQILFPFSFFLFFE